MKNPVSKVLEKKGLKPEELTPDEKATIEGWKKILSEGEVTVKSIHEFCNVQIANIERQFKELSTPVEKITRLTLLHSVYSSLRAIINSPSAQRDSLEKYLQSLL